MITQQDIIELCNSAANAGFNVNPNVLTLLQWNAGLQTHIPSALPANSAAVYIFKWNDNYLKVGKVNANSNARYQSQHYNPDSSRSNLSKSLLSDTEFQALIGDGNVGEWLKANTTRFNILIPSNLGKNFVHFAEAFFILKCNPRFENTRV
jgi:hypothetical protein